MPQRMLQFLHMRAADSRNLLAFAVALLGIILPLSFVTAQEKSQGAGLVGASGDIPSSLVSCFDYYRFGSTPVTITTSLSQAAAGASVAFEGVVKNDNPHPLVNASVYVKILRMRGEGKDANGPDVVDWLTAAGPFTLKAGETIPLTFTWKVPSNAKSGDYAAAVYVASSNRFNTFGLSFTDDIVGSLAPFSVVAGESGSLSFDKTSVTVDGQPFLFAAFPPRVEGKKPVVISARVENGTSIPKKFSITWKLYAWDALRPDALIDSKTVGEETHPGKSVDVSYTVNDAPHAVYYLLGEISDGDAKSLIGVRFVRSDVQEPRIADLGITPYPAATAATLYVCVHSTNDADVQDASLEVSLEPSNSFAKLKQSIFGGIQKTYSGPISSALGALALPLPSISGSFTVHARLMNGGAVVDDISIPYSCDALGGPCENSFLVPMLLLALVVLLAVVLTAAVLLRRTFRKSPSATNTSTVV